MLGIENWCRLSIDMHYLYVHMYLHICKEVRGAIERVLHKIQVYALQKT